MKLTILFTVLAAMAVPAYSQVIDAAPRKLATFDLADLPSAVTWDGRIVSATGVSAGSCNLEGTSATMCLAAGGIWTPVGGSLGGVNIRAYGAKGDNSTNDTAAIVAAITDSCANNLPLYIPTGIYLTDPITTICTGTTWYGDGPIASILKSRTGGDVVHYTGAALNWTQFRDFGIQGSGSGAGYGMYITPSAFGANNQYTRLTFTAIGGTCLLIEHQFTLTVEEVTGWCGAGGTGNGIDVNGSNTLYFRSNYIYSIPLTGTAYRVHGGEAVFMAVNGINSGGTWGIFGDDISEDGQTSYVTLNMISCNVETFDLVGVRLKNGSRFGILTGTKFESQGVGTRIAIKVDYVIPDSNGIISNTGFYLSGTTWENGSPIHSFGVPFINMGGGALTYYDTNSALTINIPRISTTYTYQNNSVTLDQAWLPKVNFFALGDGTGSTPKTMLYGTAAPTTGAHLVGEIVWNTVPVSGGSLGWVCTTAGTPGTWSTIGGGIGNTLFSGITASSLTSFGSAPNFANPTVSGTISVTASSSNVTMIGASGQTPGMRFIQTGIGAFYLRSRASTGDIEFLNNAAARILNLGQNGINTFYNETAGGSTNLAVRAGDTQGSTVLQSWKNNAGTDISAITAAGLPRVIPVALATLTCNAGNAGVEAAINDALTPAWGATAANGGAAFAKIVCNGTNWTVIGI